MSDDVKRNTGLSAAEWRFLDAVLPLIESMTEAQIAEPIRRTETIPAQREPWSQC